MNSVELDLNSINSFDLRAGKYKEDLPELYDLHGVVENGKWHVYQDVLEHVLKVLHALEMTLEFSSESRTDREKILVYLESTIGFHSRKNLLYLATILHDISKVDALVKNADGTANSPGHELLSAGRVSKYSLRFGLSNLDESIVERIVRFHGFVSDILTLILANGNREKYFEFFCETVGDIAIELVLFMKADLQGADLQKTDIVAFTDRLNLLNWMFNTLISRL